MDWLRYWQSRGGAFGSTYKKPGMLDEFNQMMSEVLGGLNLVVCLSIAGGVVALLIGFLVFDSLRRKRNRRKFGHRLSGSKSRGNVLTNSVRNFRSSYRALEEEMDRRQRRNDRERGRRK